MKRDVIFYKAGDKVVAVVIARLHPKFQWLTRLFAGICKYLRF